MFVARENRITTFDECLKDFDEKICKLKFNLKAFVMVKKSKLDILKQNFKICLLKYRYELALSSKKFDKELLNNYGNFNDDYNDKLLKIYLHRCIERQKMAVL